MSKAERSNKMKQRIVSQNIQMELLYLLCSIISTIFTSLALSLFVLPFHALRRLCGGATATSDSSVSLYQGTVCHDRRRPVHHAFKYPVRYAFIDLDRALQPPPDHLSADEARRVADTDGPVFLLTIPRSVGYEQNPLSLYYCYSLEGSTQYLNKCIAEVTNTPWGERVSFVFHPNSDLVAKPLHVSPFMDMLGNWRIRANDPGENLTVTITVEHPELGDYFIATLKAKSVSSSMVSDHTIFFWLMPHKVAVCIYWHALKLWWKNVSFIQHPRYSNTAYREEALLRNEKLRGCPAFGLENHKHLQATERRWIRWRDAQWPWS